MVTHTLHTVNNVKSRDPIGSNKLMNDQHQDLQVCFADNKTNELGGEASCDVFDNMLYLTIFRNGLNLHYYSMRH